MFIQTGFAVDPPTACHLVWTASYMKADLTHQLVRWCVHKLALISASLGSIGSHLLHLKTVTFISFQLLHITKQHTEKLLGKSNLTECLLQFEGSLNS